MPKTRKLEIVAIKYLIKEQITYNFNECDANTTEITRYECPWSKSLYFYQDKANGELIISTTMDYKGVYELLFALDLRNFAESYQFRFMEVEDLIREKEGKGYSAEKLAKRLAGNPSQIPQPPTNFLTSQQIPTYFHPPINKPSPSLWLVPRYMHPLQLQIGMKIRFHYKDEQEYKPKDIIVEKLEPTYTIQEVGIQQIQNNGDLAAENQANLFHICEEREEREDKEKERNNQEMKCIYCLDNQEDSIEAKNPHLLVDPCYCSGGCKYVHMKCLVAWVDTKKGHVIRCPTCKKPFPQFLQVSRITKKQQRIVRYFHLIGNSNMPYIVINERKIELYSNDVIYIGSEMRSNFRVISDEKIDFAHIIYDRRSQKAYIEDQKTQYGTLIRKKKMTVRLLKGVDKPYTCSVLLGKTLYNFAIHQSD